MARALAEVKSKEVTRAVVTKGMLVIRLLNDVRCNECSDAFRRGKFAGLKVDDLLALIYQSDLGYSGWILMKTLIPGLSMKHCQDSFSHKDVVGCITDRWRATVKLGARLIATILLSVALTSHPFIKGPVSHRGTQ